MTYQIGSDGLDLMADAIQSADTSTTVKIALVRLIGRIGEPRGLEDLETIYGDTEDPGLKMEIGVTLYRLGKQEYSTAIIKGLADDNVSVRRASARAMVHLSDFLWTKLLKHLRIPTSGRCLCSGSIPKSTSCRSSGPLTKVLTGPADNPAKQAASEALRIHAEQKLTKGLTSQLITALISGKITNAEDRLRIVQLLRKEPLMSK